MKTIRGIRVETTLLLGVAALLLWTGSGLAVGPYTDNSNQTVTDQGTGLMWENDSNVTTKTRTWDGALAYCENLTLGGYTDWRLPNFQELRSIADYSRYNPAIDSVFSAASDFYWSSTSYAASPSVAWGVYFDYGGDPWVGKSIHYYVRCVRPGLSGSFATAVPAVDQRGALLFVVLAGLAGLLALRRQQA